MLCQIKQECRNLAVCMDTCSVDLVDNATWNLLLYYTILCWLLWLFGGCADLSCPAACGALLCFFAIIHINTCSFVYTFVDTFLTPNGSQHQFRCDGLCQPHLFCFSNISLATGWLGSGTGRVPHKKRTCRSNETGQRGASCTRPVACGWTEKYPEAVIMITRAQKLWFEPENAGFF
jgi:hypothetical protein